MAPKQSDRPNAIVPIGQQVAAQGDGAPAQYATLLEDVKRRIREAQIRAAVSVNTELVLLYWSIGSDILARQHEEGWGARVIDRLSSDLRSVFPDIGGFSARNLKYMRSFAAAYPDEAIVQAVLAQIPWYHNIALLDKLKSTGERLWYAQKTIEHGWSRNVLVHQIESALLDSPEVYSGSIGINQRDQACFLSLG